MPTVAFLRADVMGVALLVRRRATFAARRAEIEVFFRAGAFVFFEAFARFTDVARTAFFAVRAVFARVLVLDGALFLVRLALAFFMIGGVGLARVAVVVHRRRSAARAFGRWRHGSGQNLRRGVADSLHPGLQGG